MTVAINGIDQSLPSVEDYGAAVQDITALKLIGPSERFDQQHVYVEDETRPYWFDLQSVAAESLPDIVQPGDAPASGRWIRMPPAGGVPDAHALSHNAETGSDALNTAAAGAIAIGDSTAVGTSESYARSDHQHSLGAPGVPESVIKFAGSAGVSTLAARADHRHDAVTSTPLTITTVNFEGSSTSLARGDHTHDHGAQTLSTHHAAAIAAGASGFMTGADKTRIDSIASLTEGSIVFASASGALAQDNSNFFWDNTVKRLGIGTNSPNAHIDIQSTLSSMQQTRWSNAAGSGSGIVIQRSRGAVVGADTVVVSGDKISSLNFRAFDGAAFVTAAQIQALVDGVPGIGDMPGRLIFLTTPAASTIALERMRIDSAGNVGIATSSPTATLAIGQVAGTDPIDNTTGLDSRSLGFETRVWDGAVPQTRTGTIRVEDVTGVNDQTRFVFRTDDNGGSGNDFLYIFRDTAGNPTIRPVAGETLEIENSVGNLAMEVQSTKVRMRTEWEVITTLTMADNVEIKMGNSNDIKWKYSSIQSNNSLLLGLQGAMGNYLLITDKDRIDSDRLLPAFSNPALVIESGNVATGEWGAFKHDGTDFVITTNTGDVSFVRGSTEIARVTASGVQSIPASGNGGLLRAIGGSATIPTLVPDVTDIDTGIGHAGSDLLSFIANGIERMRIGSGIIVSDGTGMVIGHTAQITAGDVAEFQVLGTGGPDADVIIGRWSANSTSPMLDFVKSRNAAIGSNAIVVDNDMVGRIRWFPDDGVDFATVAASFEAEVDDASPAAGDIGMAFVWQQMPGGAGALRETMRMTATGRLGIATNAPAGKLHVDQDDAAGAVPVLVLDQGDIDDTFINFIGTSAADGTRSISSDTTEDSAKGGAFRIELNGVLQWVRTYDNES